MAVHGYTWQYMTIHGCTWLYIAVHGYTWLYMAIHGCTWLSMAVHGYPWLYMDSIPKVIEKRFPFKLFYRSACSQELLDYLVVHIGRGQNFLKLTEDIMSMHFRKFSQCTSSNCDSIDVNGFYASPVYSIPSNDQLMHIFPVY